MVIKMAGHAPFGAQVILNGHEYVAITAQGEGIGFAKEGNCFTEITDPDGLAQIAGTLSQDAAAGRLGQVTGRWICTACLCFGLDLAEQERSGFRYAYSVYQAEYSRNLLFAYGGHMDRVFNAMLDRTGPGWTSRPCGPCPVPAAVPASTARSPRPGSGSRSRHLRGT
jgi:hypothetical protein